MARIYLAALLGGSALLAGCGGGNNGEEGNIAAVEACTSCHSFDADGPDRSGPNLHGIIGQQAGSRTGCCSYSSAMQESGIIWTPETLDRFLPDPQGVVPGTRMSMAGIEDAETRKQIIDFMQVH